MPKLVNLSRTIMTVGQLIRSQCCLVLCMAMLCRTRSKTLDVGSRPSGRGQLEKWLLWERKNRFKIADDGVYILVNESCKTAVN
jgi:hypothetical protein